MKMTSVILAVLLVGSATLSTGAIGAGGQRMAEEAPMDCTFTIKGTFDGVVVNVTITVSDVSLVECLVMKATAKAAIK